MTLRDAPRIAIFGAGAFGGWTALELVRRGAHVTLVDAWGPGNVRASSGGETRVIRATYGTRTVYTRMAARALELWRAHDAQWQRRFYRQTGVLWMFNDRDAFGTSSAQALRSEGIAIEELAPGVARWRYPQIDFDGIASTFVEPDAGYLLARRACEHIVERFIAEGGQYRLGAAAVPVRVDRNDVQRILLRGGDAVEADTFIFACGSWLGAMFPDVLGSLIASTRQEVYYFGTPAGDARFFEDHLPAWIEVGDRVLYGIAGNAHRGFKFADDTSGPLFDPSDGDRSATAEGIDAARAFLARRFPDLAAAPLVGAEVCQYESTPDAHFVIDRHPVGRNVWIAGGGSGHGFKMGPAVGEILAALALGGGDPDPSFSVARFGDVPVGGWPKKWS